MSKIVPIRSVDPPEKNDGTENAIVQRDTIEMITIWKRLDSFQRNKLLDIARKLRIFSNFTDDD